MSTFLLAAVGCSWRKAGVAPSLSVSCVSASWWRPAHRVLSVVKDPLSADHLVAIVLHSQGLEGGLDETTTETEDQVESGFLFSHVSDCLSSDNSYRPSPASFPI